MPLFANGIRQLELKTTLICEVSFLSTITLPQTISVISDVKKKKQLKAIHMDGYHPCCVELFVFIKLTYAHGRKLYFLEYICAGKYSFSPSHMTLQLFAFFILMHSSW